MQRPQQMPQQMQMPVQMQMPQQMQMQMPQQNYLPGHPSASKWYNFEFHVIEDFTDSGRLDRDALADAIEDQDVSRTILDGGLRRAVKQMAEELWQHDAIGEERRCEIFSASITVRLVGDDDEDDDYSSDYSTTDSEELYDEQMQQVLDRDLERLSLQRGNSRSQA